MGFKGVDAIKQAIENFATGGSVEYFSLKDDGDKAEARMLHKDSDDLDVTLVHELTVGGKKKYIECLKVYDQPCACCEQLMKPTLKMFLSMFVIKKMEHGGKKVGEWKDVGKLQVWERGRDTMNRILNLINKKGDLRKHVYEVLRTGKSGDTSTSYDIDPFDEHAHAASVAPDDLPKREDIYGTLVTKLSYDGMKELLKGGASTAGSATKKEDAPSTVKKDELPF
jgi:hypothetical protein